MTLRLHLPAIPHTITNDEYSHCAFTGKVLRFPRMMIPRGFEVYHYGVEGSTTDATKDIQLFTKAEHLELIIQCNKDLHPELTKEEIIDKMTDKKKFIGDLGNVGNKLYKEFNKRFREKLIENYRETSTDIVCLPFGRAHEDAIYGLNVVAVESGIGYNGSYKNFRIFESYCVKHVCMTKQDKHEDHYWFTVPNYYNVSEWPLSLTPSKRKIGFFGRICYIKGINIFVEIAKKFPDIDFVMCGQGTPENYLSQPNIYYEPPIHGDQRGGFLGSLLLLICPSLYLEPFCGVNIEAQLCGTPILTIDSGVFNETVEQFKTGLRCHTLADFSYGIQMAIDGKFDRQYISDRANRLYSMETVSFQYEYVFKTIFEVHNGNNGWYSDKSFLPLLENIN
jgi:glycosyltransferase involved in cell wall biosynthesis